MSSLQRFFTFIIGLGLVFAAGLSFVPAASANDEISIGVTGGTRTTSIADLTLSGLNYAHSNQTQTGVMVLTADDSTATGAGWNVTVQSSDFVYAGAYNGADIPAANFSITAANEPTMNAGQAVNATNGPRVPATSPVGSLDQARTVVHAQPEFGLGNYSQNLAISLLVPGQAREGTYTGTLTVTIAAGPAA